MWWLYGGAKGLVTGLSPQVDIELAAWTTLSSMFASAMFGPALGKFADAFGRRRMWWSGYALQVASYFICWLAPSFEVLVVGRVVGGLSWAATSPAGFGIMSRGLPPKQRGRIVAYQSATGSLGGSIGYVLGGLVVSNFGWRYLFSAPLPVLAAVWCASLFVLPADEDAKSYAALEEEKARALRERLSALSVSLCKSILYGGFVWARRALTHQKRRFPARANTTSRDL